MPEKILYRQDGRDLPESLIDFGREYEVKKVTVPDSVPDYEMNSYWRTFAAGRWPGLEICGNGQFVFISRCDKKVYLFGTANACRAARCNSYAACNPLQHDRVKIPYIPPIKNWQD